MCSQRTLAALLLFLLVCFGKCQPTRCKPTTTQQWLQQRIAAGKFSQVQAVHASAAVAAADASAHWHLLVPNAAAQFQRRLAALAAAVVPGSASGTAGSPNQERKQRQRIRTHAVRTASLSAQAKEAATLAQAELKDGAAEDTGSSDGSSDSAGSGASTGRTRGSGARSTSNRAAAASVASLGGRDWIGMLTQPTAGITSPQPRQSFTAAVPSGAEVPLDAGGSRAELGSEIKSYMWTIRGASSSNSGFTQKASGPSTTVTLQPGSYTASLEISSTGSDCSRGDQCTATDTVRFSVVGAGDAARKGASESAADEEPLSAARQPALHRPARSRDPERRMSSATAARPGVGTLRPGTGGQARSGTVDLGTITPTDLFPGIVLNPDGSRSSASGATDSAIRAPGVAPGGTVNPAGDNATPATAAPGDAAPAAAAQPVVSVPVNPGATAPATPVPAAGLGTPPPLAPPPGTPPVVPPAMPSVVPPVTPPGAPPATPPVMPPTTPPPVIPPVTPQIPRPPTPPPSTPTVPPPPSPATPPPTTPPIPPPAAPPGGAVPPPAVKPSTPPPVPPPTAPPPTPGPGPSLPTPPPTPPLAPPPVPAPAPVPAPKPATPAPMPPAAGSPAPAPQPTAKPPDEVSINRFSPAGGPTPGPKPPGPAPVPPPPPSTSDYCNPAEYDGFTDTELKDMWKECCNEANKQGIADPDCAKPQW